MNKQNFFSSLGGSKYTKEKNATVLYILNTFIEGKIGWCKFYDISCKDGFFFFCIIVLHQLSFPIIIHGASLNTFIHFISISSHHLPFFMFSFFPQNSKFFLGWRLYIYIYKNDKNTKFFKWGRKKKNHFNIH